MLGKPRADLIGTPAEKLMLCQLRAIGRLTAPNRLAQAFVNLLTEIGKNPLLIFIRDHRVINRDGSVDGFAGEWNRKPGLLDLEKRMTDRFNR